MNLADKKVAILGLGVENKALLSYLVKHQVKDITICDKKEVNINNLSVKLEKDEHFFRGAQASGKRSQFTFSNLTDIIKLKSGGDYLKGLERFDIVFRTPGLPVNTPEIVKAKKAGVKISSQMKLFFELCPAKIIGVTGTKGKGTTSTLIYEIVKTELNDNVKRFDFVFGRPSQPTPSGTGTSQNQIPSHSKEIKPTVYLAGNIGNAPIELIDKIKKDDIVILELSSFQLQDMDKSPNIAVVLNVTSDHLDYHKDTAEYVDAKKNIVRFQSKEDIAVINMDYNTSFEFAVASPSENDWYFSTKKSVDQGVYIEWENIKNTNWGKIILRDKNKDLEIVKTYDIQIRGAHNLENICAATTASYLAGADIKSINKVLTTFKGLKFRIELVWEADGVKYYNDSASTNPDTTTAAIKSFSEPIVLVAGGSDKGADYAKMGEEIVKSSVKTVILMGVTADKIKSKVKSAKLKVIVVKNLEEAIIEAKKEAKSGDVVLFSPASASFDMFKDYKDRGEQFDKLVKI